MNVAVQAARRGFAERDCGRLVVAVPAGIEYAPVRLGRDRVLGCQRIGTTTLPEGPHCAFDVYIGRLVPNYGMVLGVHGRAVRALTPAEQEQIDRLAAGG